MFRDSVHVLDGGELHLSLDVFKRPSLTTTSSSPQWLHKHGNGKIDELERHIESLIWETVKERERECVGLDEYEKFKPFLHHRPRKPSEVMFGFIAAAGTNTEEHRLLSWELSSALDIEKADSKIGLVVGISVSGFVLLIVLVHTIVVVWSRKQRKKKDRDIANMISINEDLEREAAKERVLNEVKIISKLRHRNMVQLIGWCNEKNEFLLIYELVLNGSLNSHLFGKRPHLLSWDIRYKIALGLASALLYLHEEWDQCVLHRDIKASNIMLDSDFNVKLGHFGLARVMNHEHGSHTTGLAGTFGYMAHEYVTKGSASKESDIYSFGIVLLEIVTGRKSLERTQEDNSDSESNEKSLVEKVWKLYGKQEVMTSSVDEK
ncbi:hypothetical protein ARALYDRAFT_915951 [Arabidopsis lyrata subsp. lyrata]|uniref:Protein kinase domain-containing protein n=1 Tax=Arabidopsis lyrata subsp. lyrata TaxID=81972 RepID=D7MIJ6_ARALL|nr:hypothetical protein ARALYDRAFT_915951 [Arabidopsis lyrata subsp. lyrata]